MSNQLEQPSMHLENKSITYLPHQCQPCQNMILWTIHFYKNFTSILLAGTLVLAMAASSGAEETGDSYTGSKPPPENAELRIAVFNDPDTGSTASDCVQATITILGTNGFKVSKISAASIRTGELEKYDVVMMPGGGGSDEVAALGSEGCSRLIKFVSKGGGYVGTCAGAYLAGLGHYKKTSWLQMVNTEVVDIDHWNRGTGDVQVRVTNPTSSILSVFPSVLTVHYYNGPLMRPGSSTNLPPCQVEAVFITDKHNNTKAGIMPGTAAMTTSQFHLGRCVLFSFHPELTAGLEQVEVRAVLWAAGKL